MGCDGRPRCSKKPKSPSTHTICDGGVAWSTCSLRRYNIDHMYSREKDEWNNMRASILFYSRIGDNQRERKDAPLSLLSLYLFLLPTISPRNWLFLHYSSDTTTNSLKKIDSSFRPLFLFSATRCLSCLMKNSNLLLVFSSLAQLLATVRLSLMNRQLYCLL